MRDQAFGDINDAFRTEVLRSEQRRIAWLLAAVTVIFLLVIVRNISGFAARDLLRVGGPLFAAAVLYAVLQRGMIARALRSHRAVPVWIWSANTIIDALFPSMMLLPMTVTEAVDPHAALAYPVICVYFIAIALSTLRLQPALSYLSGLMSAAGYLAIVASVHLAAAPGPRTPHLAVYVAYAVMMVVAAAASAGVAGQLRRSVMSALEQAEALRRSEIKSRNTLIFGLAKLAEYRDSDTGRHLERIAEYCSLLAFDLQETHPEITTAWLEHIPVAATLHDIGKVGLPDSVLKKAGPLTAEERLAMQAHPGLGAEALASIRRHGGDSPLLALSERIAAAHHERWDGGGYPNGLTGRAIPLAARIVALADVYDALTSVRVYKPAMSHAEAAELIRSGRGTHFDPLVVEAFDRQAEEFAATRERHAHHGESGKPELTDAASLAGRGA